METRETYRNTMEDRPERPPLPWEQQVIDAVQDAAGEALIDVWLGPDMPVLLIHSHGIRDVAPALADAGPDAAFPHLLDVTAVDYSAYKDPRPERFSVVWHFLDRRRGRRVRVKSFVAEGTSVPSLAGSHPAADWGEREVFDMMGIPFSGHPNLVRILMPEDYEGHPQRKDFPTQGPDRGKPIHGEILGNKPLTSWKELHEI
ncbi:MAG: NADH-quinone oxidoreductase subunit C [bacterium]